ncbi:MAG: hypothetical protein BWZ02_01478 [Lentisphaerae bacterium ADurb.BinA184]|nr:MAG: hypothetical protein BWZ02_01478 [Lentisphaerae bacterium ADurb.BinA184]
MFDTRRSSRLVLTFCLAALPFGALAETYFVRVAGNDQADGRIAAAAFRTIQRAAQALNHGDSVVIGPGAYRETVLFAERFSADGAMMAITGDESGKLTGDPAGAVVIEAVSASQPALHIYRFRNLTVSGLTVRGNGQGMKLEKVQGGTVARCTFDGLSRGLAITNCERIGVESCVLVRCTLGITLQGAIGTRVAHCSVAGANTAGVLVLGSGAGSIVNSLFAANNTGFIADRISAAAWTSDHNVIHGTLGPWGDVPAIANAHEWFAASGQDRASVYVVPEFARPDAMDVRPVPVVSWPGGLPGMNVGIVLDPAVVLDRDGKPFRARGKTACVGAYDYPDPVPGAGWVKLAAKPETRGLRQSAGLYRPDGSLVRMLVADAAGVSDLWWDGLDDLGQPVPAGRYEVRSVAHDVRVVDDGAFGDDGNPLGAFNCDNADRVVALADGGFVISTVYDEAGFALRAYSPSGQPVFANNLAEKDFAALSLAGADLYAVVGRPPACAIQRFALPGERVPMANGAESYPILAADEKEAAVSGLAVIGDTAFVAVSGRNEIRAFDLKTGARKAAWPLAEVADLATDGKGLWAVAGSDVVAVNPASGAPGARWTTGLTSPRYLAAGGGRLAVVDRRHGRLALLDAANGKLIKTLGQDRPAGAWMPVGGTLLRDPRGCAFLGDGRLVLTEGGRVRILWPDSGVVARSMLSNFMDVAVAHPLKPEYVYCFNMSVFHVDTGTGAWTEVAEGPTGMTRKDKDGKDVPYGYGSPSTSVVLGGKPFVAIADQQQCLRLFEVTDPARPRLAFESTDPKLRLHPYSILSFGKGGDIVANGGSYGLSFCRIPFKGLDAQGNPQYDFAGAVTFGPEKDPTPRGLKCINAPAADPVTGEVYFLAVTDLHCKMVPGWGADGTGVGKSAPDGTPLWFSLSSGGNYQSGAVLNDGRNAWYLAGKSFGGQIDLFDRDGLRLTTGNWAWPTHFGIGFVDLRYGVNPYLRPDGKVGAYVEDDAIGRFGRVRLDGAETLQRATAAIEWTAAAAAAGAPADPAMTSGKPLAKAIAIPRVAPLPVGGDWEAWAAAGVVPQIVALPVPGFKRSLPDDLWQTFRAGTAIGAVAHDGQNLYVYFLVADDTPHFDAVNPGVVWMYDGVELWLEEDQFGLAFTKDGQPAFFKFRHHNAEGKPWSANYGLGPESVWGAKLASLGTHPLGRQLADITGVSFEGKGGYAVMGRLPFKEVRLVGGIAGRGGKDILPTTGAPGEILRIGVSFGAISAWGREQDYKINWPGSLMFADPTRSVPFVFAE